MVRGHYPEMDLRCENCRHKIVSHYVLADGSCECAQDNCECTDYVPVQVGEAE